MKLPSPPLSYDPVFEAQRNLFLEQADQQNHKRLTDMEIVAPQRLILRSPDGTRFVITVRDSGQIDATAL